MNIIQDLLTPNRYSRPQRKISNVNGIVIHWVANPNSSAKANRNFFQSRKSGNSGYGSAHYIVGLKGETIQCVPDDEMAYHVGSKTYPSKAIEELGNYPNATTIGIEATHIDWNGKMTNETYNSLVELSVFLLKKFNLTEENLWLHKEVVGWKDCHRWFVNHPHEWDKFKSLVGRKLKGDDDKLQLNEWQWEMLEKTMKDLREKDVINSEQWEEKVQNRDLTNSELSWLIAVMFNRLIK